MRKSILSQLVAIVGPTASGKTAWALALAHEFNGEIVSADSRQIYRGLNIGTSKSAGTWREGIYFVQNIPYHLVDIVEPDETFTLSYYQRRAYEVIDTIVARQKLPLLVGGTGLYVQAVVDNLNIPAVAPNETLRARLAKKSTSELATILKAVDSETAGTIDSRNPRRLIRAIEVALAAKPTRKRGVPRYNTLQIGIAKSKDELYAAIDVRVDEMIEAGLVHEVEILLNRYDRTLPAFSGIGYVEIIEHLAGTITLEKAVRLIKTHTRQYARRQMTWFKRDPRIQWVRHLDEARDLVADFLTETEQRFSPAALRPGCLPPEFPKPVLNP